jgi:hypothetical protein
MLAKVRPLSGRHLPGADKRAYRFQDVIPDDRSPEEEDS